MPDGLPLIPVWVRVIGLDLTEARRAQIEAFIGDAFGWWKEAAGIEFRCWGGEVQAAEDLWDSTSTALEAALDDLEIPSAPFVSVVFEFTVGIVRVLTESGHGLQMDQTKDWNAYTFFAEPQFDRAGYGVAIEYSSDWTDLAHELGHAMGLRHANSSGSSDQDVDYDFYYAPWTDDTPDLPPVVSYAKVMNPVHLDLSDPLNITPNQILRARLTATTRDCPYSRNFRSFSPGAQSASDPALFPRMNDLCAQFIVRSFA